MNPNVKIALLCIGVIVIGGYKLLFPWTPFWVDFSVIVLGVLVFLFSGPRKAPSSDKEKANDDSMNKDNL